MENKNSREEEKEDTLFLRYEATMSVTETGIFEREFHHHFQKEKNALPYLTDIIDEMGMTKYIYAVAFCGCLLFFIEGSLTFELNFIYPELNKVLHLNTVKRSVLTSSYFLGDFLGVLFTGLIPQSFGRRLPLIFYSFVLVLFSLILILFDNLLWITFCRIMTGFSIGNIHALLLATLIEILPLMWREIVLIFSMSFNRIGVIFYVIFYQILLYEKHPEDSPYSTTGIWKYSIFLSSLITIFALIMNIIFIKDTPRFMYTKGDDKKAFMLLKEVYPSKNIKKVNEVRLRLEAEELRNLVSKENKWIQIFQSNFLKITLSSSILYCSSSINNSANLYILPLLFLNKNDSKLWTDVIFQQILGIIGLILSYFLIHSKTIGRKYTIFISDTLIFFGTVMTLIQNSGFEIASPILNLFILITHTIIKIYIAEAFPTNLRVNALAVCMSVGQLANFFTPPLCDLLFRVGNYLPILIMTISSFLGSIICLLLPYDTTNKAIDTFYTQN